MRAERLYRALFALIAWLGLGLQYWLSITGNPDKTFGELTLTSSAISPCW